MYESPIIELQSRESLAKQLETNLDRPEIERFCLFVFLHVVAVQRSQVSHRQTDLVILATHPLTNMQ